LHASQIRDLSSAADRNRRSTPARVIVDTTVQPKNITFPTDAKLMNRAREKLVKLANKHGVELRQSYVRSASSS
jgi:transposase, IS5 family